MNRTTHNPEKGLGAVDDRQDIKMEAKTYQSQPSANVRPFQAPNSVATEHGPRQEQQTTKQTKKNSQRIQHALHLAKNSLSTASTWLAPSLGTRNTGNDLCRDPYECPHQPCAAAARRIHHLTGLRRPIEPGAYSEGHSEQPASPSAPHAPSGFHRGRAAH